MRSAWATCLLLIALQGCEDGANKDLDGLAPFPEILELENKLKPPQVDPTATRDGTLSAQWDFKTKRKLEYEFLNHSLTTEKYGDVPHDEGSKIQSDLIIRSVGNGKASVHREKEKITLERSSRATGVLESRSSRSKPPRSFVIGEDGKQRRDVLPNPNALAVLLALPTGEISIGARQKLKIRKKSFFKLTDEFEFVLVGFLERNGKRCALFDITMRYQEMDIVGPGDGSFRVAREARGWSLYDTVDQSMDSAQLVVYSGSRMWATLTPEKRQNLCVTVFGCEQIPDRFQYQKNKTEFLEFSRVRQVTPSAKCFSFADGDDVQVCVSSDSTSDRMKAKKICAEAKGSDCGDISNSAKSCYPNSNVPNCYDENGKAHRTLEGY